MSHLSWYFRTWLHWDKASSPQCLLSFIKMMEELLWNGNRDHNMGTILTLQADATLKQTAKEIIRAVACEPKREVWRFLWAWPMPPLKHVFLLLNLEYITWAFFLHYLQHPYCLWNIWTFFTRCFQIEEHLTLENTIITRLNLSKPLWLQRLKCELLVVFHIQLRAEWGLNP